MSRLEKLGYILIGVGIGGLAATLFYEHELSKPVGEVEEFVPEGGFEDDSTDDAKSNKTDESIETTKVHSQLLADMYRSDDKNLTVSDSAVSTMQKHGSDTRKVRYDKIYNIDTDIPVEKIPNGPEDDTPEEAPDLGDFGLVRERVEKNFEIYLEDNPQDFVTVIFYAQDHTLTDDMDQIIPNPEEVVGDVALSRLIEGGSGAEEGTIYVRNLKTTINYEIVLDTGSYSEIVSGTPISHTNDGADTHVDTR
jgi:hypothetical protein